MKKKPLLIVLLLLGIAFIVMLAYQFNKISDTAKLTPKDYKEKYK